MQKKTHLLNDLKFYKTAPNPCPYLDHLSEVKALTSLEIQEAEYVYSDLINIGFRRSQNLAYKPICKSCQACQSIRIIVDQFKPNKTQKRILKSNTQLYRKIKPPHLLHTHYKLYQKYIHNRHKGGEMASMSFDSVREMVENTHIDSIIVEYYHSQTHQICGWVLTDLTLYGPSMVYSVFDPDFFKQSLGIYLILNHIDLSIKLGTPYLFLGYWVKDCSKMTYKTQFKPYELYRDNQWIYFDK